MKVNITTNPMDHTHVLRIAFSDLDLRDNSTAALIEMIQGEVWHQLAKFLRIY